MPDLHFFWGQVRRSRARATIVLALLSALLPGCGKSVPPGGDTVSPPNAREAIIEQVRLDVVGAAQLDKQLFAVLARGGARPRPEDFPTGNLAALLLAIDPSHAESPYRDELDRELKLGPLHQLAAAFRDGPDAGQVSPIQAADIREVTVEQKGDSAQGIVRVQVPEALEARLTYHARLRGGKWQVERFSLPAWGAESVLNDGKWTLTGTAFDHSFLIDLPKVAAAEAFPKNAGRLTIFLVHPEPTDGRPGGLSRTEDDAAATFDPNVRVICGAANCLLKEEGNLIGLLAAALGRLPRDAKVPPISIRADQSLSAGSLNRAVRTFRAMNMVEFLVVEGENFASGEMPLEPAMERPKEAPETLQIRVLAREDGTPATLVVPSLGLSLSEIKDLPAELRKLPPAQTIDFQFDPRLKAAHFAQILAELQNPSQPGKWAKRRVLFDVLGPDDSRLEAIGADVPKDAVNPPARIDGK
jgi:hypothetical protein